MVYNELSSFVKILHTKFHIPTAPNITTAETTNPINWVFNLACLSGVAVIHLIAIIAETIKSVTIPIATKIRPTSRNCSAKLTGFVTSKPPLFKPTCL